MRDRDVTVLVSSPLERAQQTAEPLAVALGLTPRIDDRLIESANVFEGLTVEFGAGSFKNPRLWRHLYDPFTPSWGEPYAAIARADDRRGGAGAGRGAWSRGGAA